MEMTVVHYRTTYVSYNQYAVIPTPWLSDLLDWLTLSESAEIVSVKNSTDKAVLIPNKWPACHACGTHCMFEAVLDKKR